jgi:hypothetical protein
VRIGRILPGAPDQFRCLAGDGSAWLQWLFGPSQMGGTVSTSFIIYSGNSSTDLTKIGTLASWGDESWSTHDYQYRIENMRNGEGRWVSVAAVNSVGEGVAASPLWVRPMSGPWNLSANLGHLETPDPGPVTLTWMPPNSTESLSHYLVWSIKTGEHIVESNTTSFNETVSMAWGIQYRVAAVYENGDRVYSDYLNIPRPMFEGDGGLGILTAILLLGSIALASFGIIWAWKKRKRTGRH